MEKIPVNSSEAKKKKKKKQEKFTASQFANYQFLKTRSAVWFCDVWKPCVKEYVNSVNDKGEEVETPVYYTDSNGKEYKGVPWYDDLDVKLSEWEISHVGCKWAYAVHEKGHTMADYPHEECEHKHFVLVQTNACSGSAMLKHFYGANINRAYTRVENCANYLLHLSPSAIKAGKPRIPFEDLYCSGKGAHGQIWFPLMSAIEYETFIPSETIHLVYNEGMTNMIQFISRFGSCVCHGSYLSTVHTCLDEYRHNAVSLDNIKEIFDLLSQEDKNLCLKLAEVGKFEDLQNKIKFDSSGRCDPPQFCWDFQCIYIWLHNTWRSANERLLCLFRDYRLDKLFDENQKRIDAEIVVEKNSEAGEHRDMEQSK